ncbi:MAG: activator of HSP90 ATPase 1 family protein [Saprospirales bacterium]|nr:MAG: activator of HSP90 ATPase 1 family protein [Saprospirales bacterium]
MKRVKFDMEFLFKASPAILHNFLTTPSCLVRWFCDEVDIDGDVYTFYWEGYAESAILVEHVEEERLRFKWDDADDEDEYFEYRLSKSGVTNETILEITDFADEDEVDDQKHLWESQIAELKKETGG